MSVRMTELSLPIIKNAGTARQSPENTARGDISRYTLDETARPQTVSTFNPYQVGRMFRTSHSPATPRPSTVFSLEPSIGVESPRHSISPRRDFLDRRNRAVFGRNGPLGQRMSLQLVGGFPEGRDFKKGAGITGTLAYTLLCWRRAWRALARARVPRR